MAEESASQSRGGVEVKNTVGCSLPEAWMQRSVDDSEVNAF
jgi:hypothetical protein